MNILIIGFDWNGLARHNPAALLRKLARDHIDRTHDRVVLWEFAPTEGDFSIADTVRVINRRGRFPGARALYDLRAPALLAHDLERSGFVPDAVVCYDFPLLAAAERVKKRFGARVILFLTNLPTDLAKTRSGASLKSAYHRYFERRAAQIVDGVIAINETTRSYAQSLGIAAERIRVAAPDTISADAAYIAAAKKGVVRQRFSIPEAQRILLSIGRLEPEKGFDTLIRAFAALKRTDMDLVIVGEGRLRTELESLAQKEGVSNHVHFAGAVGRDILWQYFADADAFILLSRSEALGLVVWEAMYAGVPVIVSGAGGLAESVGADGERGFLWRGEEGSAALIARLEQCFDRATIAPLIARARAYVERRLGTVSLSTLISSL